MGNSLGARRTSFRRNFDDRDRFAICRTFLGRIEGGAEATGRRCIDLRCDIRIAGRMVNAVEI